MRKFICLITIVILFFSGCQMNKYTLLDHVETIDEVDNVVAIPNEIIENASYPEIYTLGENFLIVSYPEVYGEDGTPETQIIELTLMSGIDGSFIAKEEVPHKGAEIQIINDHVAILDGYLGRVYLFDDKLEKTLYELDSDEVDTMYMSYDLKSIYVNDWETGIGRFDIETETYYEVLQNITFSHAILDENNNLFCHYVDLKSQTEKVSCLNLKTGSIELAPLEYDIGYECSKESNNWVIASEKDENKYYIYTDGEEKTIQFSGTGAEIYNGKLLLKEERSISFCDLNGTYLTGFTLPEDGTNFLSHNIAWSDYWKGYFLVEYREEGPRLLFWDSSKTTVGEGVEIKATEEPIGIEVSRELYLRANDLSKQFGVEIHIADLCENAYAEYTCSIETNEDNIREALDSLEKYMSAFPSGFLKQLRYANIGPMRIEIVTDLQRNDGLPPSAAFVWGNIMVLDSQSITDFNFYHEISHVIDQKLAIDNELREDSAFSEEAWLELQPEGFEYLNTYEDYQEVKGNYKYFVSQYSMTFPTEDRAELFDYAMRNSMMFEESEALYEKIEFYSKCIRECFDTTGWPEVTQWEKVLH